MYISTDYLILTINICVALLATTFTSVLLVLKIWEPLLYEITDSREWFWIDYYLASASTNVNIALNRDFSDERARRLAISINQHNYAYILF